MKRCTCSIYPLKKETSYLFRNLLFIPYQVFKIYILIHVPYSSLYFSIRTFSISFDFPGLRIVLDITKPACKHQVCAFNLGFLDIPRRVCCVVIKHLRIIVILCNLFRSFFSYSLDLTFPQCHWMFTNPCNYFLIIKE